MITPTPDISTDRLILRAPVPQDWEAFRPFALSERAKGIGGPFDLGKAWRTFATEMGHWAIFGYGMWIVTRKGDDTALAMIGPWTPADWPEKEIGWMVFDPALEGTGIATEAARAAIDHAYGVLGWDTIVSYVGAGNLRSAALAEKLGAQRDETAPQPYKGETCWIYRHPKPEAP
ncbi:N-acetyltransferase [Amylibacter marinus]|uniref:N-acetyltransferase n=1 Tax=Amylibacter marinus TaxID=1475483 RepID=A0ABQ5VX47_9RHOB|nr:GNAT family N-acetyltransferase [Amylibacter marinus]GLQ35874.1 N-acetyltransferase [Amylibacter marinus]